MNSATIRRPLPGDLAIWFFIYAELAVFGILFIAYAITRQNHPDIFAEGYLHLNRTAGLINTIALISASFFVARASLFLRWENSQLTQRNLIYGVLCALVYLLVKLVEYKEAFTAGYDLTTNIFYTFYFLLTIFHFAHVVLGVVILLVMLRNARNGYYQNNSHAGFESGASYWHMVDLVWVVLFPIVYVIH